MKLLVPASLLAFGAVVVSAVQLPLGSQSPANDELWQIISGDETFAGLGQSKASSEGLKSSKPKSNVVFSEKWEKDGRMYIQDVHYNKITQETTRQPVFELIKHEEFPDYQVRFRQPKLCDTSVKQYSGYLDISEDKHLFFWYVL